MTPQKTLCKKKRYARVLYYAEIRIMAVMRENAEYSYFGYAELMHTAFGHFCYAERIKVPHKSQYNIL